MQITPVQVAHRITGQFPAKQRHEERRVGSWPIGIVRGLSWYDNHNIKRISLYIITAAIVSEIRRPLMLNLNQFRTPPPFLLFRHQQFLPRDATQSAVMP